MIRVGKYAIAVPCIGSYYMTFAHKIAIVSPFFRRILHKNRQIYSSMPYFSIIQVKQDNNLIQQLYILPEVSAGCKKVLGYDAISSP